MRRFITSYTRTLLTALEGDVGKGGGDSLEVPEVSAPTPVAKRGGMAGGNAGEGSLALPGTGLFLLVLAINLFGRNLN